MQKLVLATLLAVASVSAWAGVNDKFLGDATNPIIEVGESDILPFGSGKVGISINGSNFINLVDGPFYHIKKKFNNTPINTSANQNVNGALNPTYLTLKDVNKVIGFFYNPTLGQVWYEKRANNTEVISVRQIAEPAIPAAPKFGGLVVAKVPNAEVYFGEWAPRAANPSTGSNTNLGMNNAAHTVFFVGENPTGNTTGLATAKYAVLGVNQHTPGQNDFFTGELTANFGSGDKGDLTGTLSRGAEVINFAGTKIDNAFGTFERKMDNNEKEMDVSGRFYGAQAAALAGYAKRGTPDQRDDVAFGGAKK